MVPRLYQLKTAPPKKFTLRIDDDKTRVDKIFFSRLPRCQNVQMDVSASPTTHHNLAGLMTSKKLINFNRPADALLHRFDGDLGARVEKWWPLLNRQVPGVARLLGDC